MSEPPTTREVLDAAARQLQAAGVPSPRFDAEALLAHCLGVTRSGLWSVRGPLEPGPVAAFVELVGRRAAREPLQHLTGTAPFRFVEVAVGPGVFVPRPETELLVDAVLPQLRQLREPTVVDLCAGSGALALAIANEVPTAHVYALEASPAAVSWLNRNAWGERPVVSPSGSSATTRGPGRSAAERREPHPVPGPSDRAEGPGRVAVVAGDVRDATALAELDGTVDVVVSNPPYVPTSADVSAEVRHDPAGAVFAGADGLALMPAVIAAAARLLRRGGALALEHDDTHAQSVPALLAADGRWTEVRDHQDLTGRPRYATARRI